MAEGETSAAAPATIQIVLLGNSAVGKTALTAMFLQGAFPRDHDPTIEDQYRKEFVVDGKTHYLMVTDTGGLDDYADVIQKHYASGHCFILVFSVTDPDSFKALATYRDTILKQKNSPRVPTIIVANKQDAGDARKVSAEEVKEFAAHFFPTVRGPHRAAAVVECAASNKEAASGVFEAVVKEYLASSGLHVTAGGGTYSGWLTKPGGGAFSSAQRRWFTLKNGKLQYFKSQEAADGEPIAELNLKAASVLLEGPTQIRLAGPHLNPGKPSKSYVLQTPSEEETAKWKAQLTIAIELIS